MGEAQRGYVLILMVLSMGMLILFQVQRPASRDTPDVDYSREFFTFRNIAEPDVEKVLRKANIDNFKIERQRFETSLQSLTTLMSHSSSQNQLEVVSGESESTRHLAIRYAKNKGQVDIRVAMSSGSISLGKELFALASLDSSSKIQESKPPSIA